MSVPPSAPGAVGRPVRWGVLGTGSIAGSMVRALRQVPEARVVAVGSRDPDRARRFAEAHGIPRAHGSTASLAGDDEVDVVHVATPHALHEQHAVACLEAGRHVLCEKPLTTSAEGTRRTVAAARSAGRLLVEALWTCWIPAVVEVRDLVRAGAIGEVRAVRADFGLRVDPAVGRLVDPALGGGSLLDMGVYPVALSRLLLGPPDEVAASGTVGPTGVDVNVGALLGHPGGAVATFHTSLESRTSHGAEVTGTEGRITLDAPFWAPAGYTLQQGGDVERVERPHRGLAHEVEHVHALLAAGATESDVWPLDTSVAVAETLDALLAAVAVSDARPRRRPPAP